MDLFRGLGGALEEMGRRGDQEVAYLLGTIVAKIPGRTFGAYGDQGSV